MDLILTVFRDTFSDSNSLLVALLVFLAAGTLAFSVMAVARVRGAVKRRTARIMVDDKRKSTRSLRHSSLKAVTQLIEYTTRHYAAAEDDSMKVLRQRLVQAGIYDTRGVAFFFIIRTGLAIGLAVALFLIVPMVRPNSGSYFWLMVIVGRIAGYVGPSK